ncbi:hypothetical protein [Sebaldella sp. S0638]|uniref:hypothetical protein n=1 Tax=Sebaldella sp. S0638 TaxID=2957809 RepID=UPI00209F07C8|nr:hypothetical protein [Sebaldella sp. S0638]MCP1223498.1 hypothetical protein [Sebaldella sp. S0638]
MNSLVTDILQTLSKFMEFISKPSRDLMKIYLLLKSISIFTGINSENENRKKPGIPNKNSVGIKKHTNSKNEINEKISTGINLHE